MVPLTATFAQDYIPCSLQTPNAHEALSVSYQYGLFIAACMLCSGDQWRHPLCCHKPLCVPLQEPCKTVLKPPCMEGNCGWSRHDLFPLWTYSIYHKHGCGFGYVGYEYSRWFTWCIYPCRSALVIATWHEHINFKVYMHIEEARFMSQIATWMPPSFSLDARICSLEGHQK